MNELMSVSKSGLLILGCHGNGFYSFLDSFSFFFVCYANGATLVYFQHCTHTHTHTDYTKEMIFTGFVSGRGGILLMITV